MVAALPNGEPNSAEIYTQSGDFLVAGLVGTGSPDLTGILGSRMSRVEEPVIGPAEINSPKRAATTMRGICIAKWYCYELLLDEDGYMRDSYGDVTRPRQD